jgi:hypothetical protein
MAERKVVGRGIAIGLGIICIVLIAGLVGALAYYTIEVGKWKITHDDYALTHVYSNTDYNAYVNDHGYTNEQYNSLSSQNTNLQNQVNDLNDTLNLGKSTVWVYNQTVSQPAGYLDVIWTTWTPSANYAGFVSIDVLSSTTSSTYVRVFYSAYGANMGHIMPEHIFWSGTAVFPILPSPNILVQVGNGNLVDGATETVTITYYY